MAYVKPTSYTAMKPIRLSGLLYTKGAPIPPAVMQQQKKANMLVSGGWVKAEPDPHRRRGPWRRRPTTVHAALQSTGITRGTEMTTQKQKRGEDDEPRNTLTDTGMEATKEERQKAGEDFNKAVSELKPAGDPSDFAQERIRTTPENKSDDAADDDLYPDDTEGDAGKPGREPEVPSPYDDDDDDDDVSGTATSKEHKTVAANKGEEAHPTDAEKRAAEDRRAKETHRVPPPSS
jgi:hypothetical protein